MHLYSGVNSNKHGAGAGLGRGMGYSLWVNKSGTEGFEVGVFISVKSGEYGLNAVKKTLK